MGPSDPGTAFRLAELQRMLAARANKAGYGRNVQAIRGAISRLQSRQEAPHVQA